MEAVSSLMVAAAKLPMLNPGEFELGIGAPRENMNREPIRRNVIVKIIETKALWLKMNWVLQVLQAQILRDSNKHQLLSSEHEKKSPVFTSVPSLMRCAYAHVHYNALTELIKKFEKAKKERDDLKLTLEKFGNSSKNQSKLLEIQVSDKFKTDVGFDSQVVDSQVFDSQVNDKHKTGEVLHAVSPPTLGYSHAH
ncbi:hypothetical protein Tco_1320761 [Tanacetum coccineum]